MNINDRIAQAVGHVKHETPKPFKSSRPIKTFKTFHDDLDKNEVKIDLNQPMEKILAQLSKHPAKTRVSLTGTLVVARDLAHSKIKELIDSGKPMPQYLKDHAVDKLL